MSAMHVFSILPFLNLHSTVPPPPLPCVTNSDHTIALFLLPRVSIAYPGGFSFSRLVSSQSLPTLSPTASGDIAAHAAMAAAFGGKRAQLAIWERRSLVTAETTVTILVCDQSAWCSVMITTFVIIKNSFYSYFILSTLVFGRRSQSAENGERQRDTWLTYYVHMFRTTEHPPTDSIGAGFPQR